jgi:hypothetical protein
MSGALAATTARRLQLQAECNAQRAALARDFGSLEGGLRPVDRGIEWFRAFGPLAAVVGVTALVVVGPGRALRATQGALSFALVATQALRLFR